jgi:hypothetical protein
MKKTVIFVVMYHKKEIILIDNEVPSIVSYLKSSNDKKSAKILLFNLLKIKVDESEIIHKGASYHDKEETTLLTVMSYELTETEYSQVLKIIDETDTCLSICPIDMILSRDIPLNFAMFGILMSGYYPNYVVCNHDNKNERPNE